MTLITIDMNQYIKAIMKIKFKEAAIRMFLNTRKRNKFRGKYQNLQIDTGAMVTI
jgi:hypothetical protein